MGNPINSNYINARHPMRKELWLPTGIFTKSPNKSVQNQMINMYDVIDNRLIDTGLINAEPCCTAYAQNAHDHTPVSITTTALATLPTILSGIKAAWISSTSVAAVTLQLDTATNYATQLGAVKGTTVDFVVDNSDSAGTAGANTITVVVGSGITVDTPAITGGGTLTVSAANKVGWFRLFFTSATTATIRRIS